MSYSDYFRKLNFSAVASGVQNMKNNEFSKLTNPINQQIDGFQTDIEGLQKSLADQSASLGTASSILEMAGGLAAQKGISKLGGKLISKVKEKLISKVKEKLGIKDSKKQSNENNEPEPEADADQEPDAFESNTYENQQGEITDSANILEDAEVPSEFGDRPIVGRAVGNQYDQQQEPSNAPEGVEYEEQTIPDEMVGGDKGGSYEMQTFKTQQPGNDELNETDPNEFHEQLDTGNPDADVNPEAQVDNTIEQTVEKETTQIGEEGADVGVS